MMPADAPMLALVRRRQLPERRIKATKSFVAAWILPIPALTLIADAVNGRNRNRRFAKLRSLDPKPAARIFSSSRKSINP
jgi:hypothetical protein